MAMFLQVVAGLAVLAVGVGAECAAGYAIQQSGKLTNTNADEVAYGCLWTVGLVGGAILLISGVFITAHAFV